MPAEPFHEPGPTLKAWASSMVQGTGIAGVHRPISGSSKPRGPLVMDSLVPEDLARSG
jgi:hypothetical protein